MHSFTHPLLQQVLSLCVRFKARGLVEVYPTSRENYRCKQVENRYLKPIHEEDCNFK